MEESKTYQAIIKKGSVRGERKLILLQGTRQFGEPSLEVLAALNAITNAAQLEELGLRLLQANSWEELLAPSPTRRTRRRGRNSE